MRSQSGRVTQGCHNSPVGKRRLASANDITHRKRAEDFGRFWKSQFVEMRPASEEDGWFSLARGDLCGGCHTCWWWGVGRWKSQNRKVVPLSPYVEKPLNSRVIKSFVPKQRSRYVFFVFRDSYVLSLWTFDVRFTQSHNMTMVQKFLFTGDSVCFHSVDFLFHSGSSWQTQCLSHL